METVRYAAKHGKSLKNTLTAINERKPFNAGNLWARSHAGGVYRVYSYNTPIAEYSNGEWKIASHRYSNTTTNHRHVIVRGVGYDTPYTDVDVIV